MPTYVATKDSILYNIAQTVLLNDLWLNYCVLKLFAINKCGENHSASFETNMHFNAKRLGRTLPILVDAPSPKARNINK